MKPVGSPTQQATEALRTQAESLRESATTKEAELNRQYQRNIPQEAGVKPNTEWAKIPADVLKTYERISGERNEIIRKLDGAVRETRRLLQPLDGLLRYLDGLKPMGEAGGRVDLELYQREMSAWAVSSVRKMLEAVGPDLAKQFPTAQLDLLEKALNDEIGELKKQVAAKKPAPQQAAASNYGGGYSNYGGGYGAPAQVAAEPVILSLAKIPDLAAGAKAIAEKLGAPALEAELTAAAGKLQGVAAEKFATAVRGWAMLADFATGSLDYKRVGSQLTFPGSASQDRTDHRTRRYDPRWIATSQPRQEESKRALRDAVSGALKGADAAGGLESELVRGFLREVGLTAAETAGWKPSLDAVVKALDAEAFVPLRAFTDLLPNGYSGRYGGHHVDGMKTAVRQIARAVVEGRFPDSRLDDANNRAQLALLPGEDKQRAWLGNHRTEANGSRGQKVSTHEAEGFELFWATKIGGPSHGFDNMTHCTLSIVGNVRTKAIVVDDANWHQPAARAYLRLLGNDRGRPMLYVEDPQYDFRLKSSANFDKAAVDERVVTHAVARARELGTDLVISDLLRGALDKLGVKYARYDGKIVLEPSAVVAEASDSMLGHDQPQTERLVARSHYPFVEVSL